MPAGAVKATLPGTLASLRIIHGERVIDGSTGVTKRQLIEHYAATAPLMLPHLKGRPVALLRAPSGLGVSVPVAWDELALLTSGAHWTVQTVNARLATGNQPWDRYETSRKGLAAAMKKLGFKTEA